MRKKGVLAKTLSSKIQLSTLLMDLHFNKSVQTSQNPYLSIDAFVWSLILCEKIDRYNDKVYQFSEYIVQNYWHMKRHNLSDLMEGIAEFDVFLIEPKYQ